MFHLCFFGHFWPSTISLPMIRIQGLGNTISGWTLTSINFNYVGNYSPGLPWFWIIPIYTWHDIFSICKIGLSWATVNLDIIYIYWYILVISCNIRSKCSDYSRMKRLHTWPGEIWYRISEKNCRLMIGLYLATIVLEVDAQQKPWFHRIMIRDYR